MSDPSADACWGLVALRVMLPYNFAVTQGTEATAWCMLLRGEAPHTS